MKGALVFAVVFLTAFGASLIGMALQRRLPVHHITAETREPLKAVLGLVATLAALLISLLIASAKETYGTQRREVEELAVGFSQFDRILAHLGPDGAALRPLAIDMRQATRDALWRHGEAGVTAERRADAASDRLIDSLSGLQTTTPAQATMRGRLIELFSSVSRNRLLLAQQASGTVPPALLGLLSATIAALFLGFALLAPTNPTLMVAAAVGAFVIAAAVLLLVAFDHPFEGLMALQPFAAPPR